MEQREAEDSMDDVRSNRRFQHDKIQLLNILPEEIWLEIFGRIIDPKDKESFSNSSLFFRELVLAQRTEFLMKSVWEVLGKKYEKNISIRGSAYRDMQPTEEYHGLMWGDDSDSDVYDSDNDETEATLRGNLVVTVIQRVRSVCKSWDEAVAHFYGNHYLHYQEDGYNTRRNSVEEATKKIILEDFWVKKPDHVNKFLDHFGTTHDSGNRSPFFGKSIDFDFSSGDSEKGVVYRNKILSILRQYGHHIWNCTITITEVCPKEPVKCYSTLWTLLELLPNLKVLRVNFRPHFQACWNIKIEPIGVEQLEAEISARPLRTLKDLQLLSMWKVYAPIFQELVRRYPHVTSLESCFLRHQEDCDIYSVPLPKLKTLHTLFSTEANFVKQMNPLVKWPLHKLSVNLSGIEFVEWQRIFNVLQENWTGSLTELAIALPVAKEVQQKRKLYQDSMTLQFNFPHLKFLSVSIRNLCSLDFLLSLKNSLKYLEIATACDIDLDRFPDVDNLEKSNAIKLLSCTNSMRDSSIWLLLPKLKRLQVEQLIVKENYLLLSEKWSLRRAKWECQDDAHLGNNRDVKTSPGKRKKCH